MCQQIDYAEFFSVDGRKYHRQTEVAFLMDGSSIFLIFDFMECLVDGRIILHPKYAGFSRISLDGSSIAGNADSAFLSKQTWPTKMAFARLINSSVIEYTEEFAGASNTEELLDCLFEIIPINREKLNNIQVKGSVRKLKASFECNLINEAVVKSFASSYTQLSNETYTDCACAFNYTDCA